MLLPQSESPLHFHFDTIPRHVFVCLTFKQKAVLYVSTMFSVLITAIAEYYIQYRLRLLPVLKANGFAYNKEKCRLLKVSLLLYNQ